MLPLWRFATLGATLIPTILPASAHDVHTPPSLPAIVSATWLSDNLNNSRLVVVDLRDSQAYGAGHIPSSLSLPYQGTALWTSNGADNQTLVMPSAEVIIKTLSENGIGVDHRAVFVSDSATLPLHMAMATRAAATLRYAGLPIENLAILDGGYPAWAAAKLQISTAAAGPRQRQYFTGTTDGSFIVERDYVRARIGKAAEGVVLIDARAPADYRAGHIESAISLPAVGIWNPGGMWKAAQELRGLFEAAVGSAPVGQRKGEVVVYCRTGMLATTWVYALTNMLGFENVKLYDGSYEDWVKHQEVVTAPQA